MHEDYIQTKHILSNYDLCCKMYVKEVCHRVFGDGHILLMKVLLEFSLLELACS